MKIGVVCEGMTDYHAINYYITAALSKIGVFAEFVALQPAADNTSGGGWSNALTWLIENPSGIRSQLFGSGLFANSKKLSELDFILIHLDTDILTDTSFSNYLNSRNFQLGSTYSLDEKATEISKVIEHFAGIADDLTGFVDRYITAPIAESSEAWCVAVDAEFAGDAESLSGQLLIDAFGAAFARFNGTLPKANYSSINKRVKSRENYCKATAANVDRLYSCMLFNRLLEKLTPA